MGYPTVSNFDNVFIQRTLDNLDGEIKNSYTHLINSLLGLVILPRQWICQKKRKVDSFDKKLAEFDDLNFLKEISTFVDENNKEQSVSKLTGNKAFEEMKVIELTNRIRNSLAHLNIRPTKESDSWAGVIFRNYSSDKEAGTWSDNYNFQLYLTMSEIKLFSVFISNLYLGNKE